MAESPSSNTTDSPRRMLLWSPMSLPPRLHGTPSFASAWAATPRSLPILMESTVLRNPSPALSRPDPETHGGNWSYQNMDFENEHLAALSASDLARLRSDTPPTWTVEISGWDRQVRRKDSWYDEDFFVPPLEIRKKGPLISQQTGVRNGDVDIVENPDSCAVLLADLLEDIDHACGATHTPSPGPGMTAHDVTGPPAPETQQTGAAYTRDPQALAGNDHMTSHETEAENDQVVSCLVDTDLLTEPTKSPTEELLEPSPSSTGRFQDLTSSTSAAFTMNSPSKPSFGKPSSDQIASSLRPTAPIFAPADLEIWPNSPSSFSPSPILTTSMVVVPPMSPADSYATTERFIPIAPGPSSTMNAPMGHHTDYRSQWKDLPATTKISWPTGQPGYTLDEQLDIIEREKIRAATLQSSSGFSVDDSETGDILSSTEISVGPSPYSLTSYQSTRPMPTPEQGLEKAGCGEIMSHGVNISPFGHGNNSFARAPPIAPRAMLQQGNIAYPAASWTNSKTWVSEEARKRDEFARMQERARHIRTDKSPYMPQTFEEYLLQKVHERESKIQEMQKKIQAKEEETASRRYAKGHHHALEPLHPVAQQPFGNDPRAGAPAVLGPQICFSPNESRVQYEIEWPSISQLKVEGDRRIQNGFPNRRLPPPCFKESDPRLAHLSQESTIVKEDNLIPHQLTGATGVRWGRNCAAAHDSAEFQETDVDGVNHPDQSLIRRIGDWVNEVDIDE